MDLPFLGGGRSLLHYTRQQLPSLRRWDGDFIYLLFLFVYLFVLNLGDIYLLSHITSHGYEWLNLMFPQGNRAVLHPMENCGIWSQYEVFLVLVPEFLWDLRIVVLKY